MTQHFFSKMNNKYGEHLVHTMKELFKIQFKLVKALNKKLFLLRCRKNRVFTKTRMLKNVYNVNPTVFDKLQKRFIFAIISQEIAETFANIKKLNNLIDIKIQHIKNIISPYFFRNFKSKFDESFQQRYDFIKAIQINKFNKISYNVDNNINNTENNTVVSGTVDVTNNKWLVNLTNIELPSTVTAVLKLGDKFCPPTIPKSIPYTQIIANVEGALSESNDSIDKPRIRNELVNILTNFKNRTNHRQLLPQPETQLLNQINYTKKFLKDHPDILVSKADKGNTTVLINKTDYIDKISDMLEDNTTYKCINKDTTATIQRKLNTMVGSWEKQNKITCLEGKLLKSYHGVVAKLYGLPKIHKVNVPYRPIVSSIGTPLYQLSAFLSVILNKTVGMSRTSVKNSIDFKNKIANIVLPNNYIILSLDVVSLFTNIDSNLVLELLDKRWIEIKNNSGTNLNKIQYIDAMKLVLNNCEFTFNQKTYRQLFGSPMGSPTSPAVAELVMEFVETSVLSSLDFAPRFFYRYVDDIITAIPADKIDTFFEAFNTFDNNIKFTIELEKEKNLAFLDLLVLHNNDGSLLTDWFHKSTWSGRYLNFNSHLPLSYKRNTIKLLTQKIIQLSDPIFHSDNFRSLKQTLLENNYPNSFINSTINSVSYQNSILNSNQSVEITPTLTNVQPKYLSIPYVKLLHEQISHCLQKFDLKVVGTSFNSFGKSLFSPLKDPTTLSNKRNVVYKVNCQCGKSYVGQTQQLLGTRITQHKRDAQKLTLKKVNHDSTSALSAHLYDTKHDLFIDNVTVLETEKNCSTRRFLEMIHIKTNKNGINKQSDCAYLQNTYNHLL